MAELATIARPYAEALFKVASPAEAPHLLEQIEALAAVAASPQLRQFAADPKVSANDVSEVIEGVAGVLLKGRIGNFLSAVIGNGRVAALPEIARQLRELVNARSGVSDAVVHSAFALDGAQLDEVMVALEKRFGRKLKASVAIDPRLIGGIRVVVGDEVLDLSVAARLEQMKVALSR